MSDRPEINFTRGVPATESFPIEDMAAAAQRAIQKYGTTILQYGKSFGFAPLRDWLAEWRGVSPEQVLTGNGSLQIVEFLCFHSIRPGDVVFTEVPTYDRTITLLRRHGAKIVGIPLEPDGPNLEALRQPLRSTRLNSFISSPISRILPVPPARSRSGSGWSNWRTSTASSWSRTRPIARCATKVKPNRLCSTSTRR